MAITEAFYGKGEGWDMLLLGIWEIVGALLLGLLLGIPMAFARFGAKLDDDTRTIIEHGRRIRACLKQPEFAPVSVPAQIALLLALSENLFDPVPLDQMTKAEQTLRKASLDIPLEVRKRLEGPAKLNAEDRETIIRIARKALTRFQPNPESKPDDKAKPKPEPEFQPESQAEVKPKPKAALKE